MHDPARPGFRREGAHPRVRGAPPALPAVASPRRCPGGVELAAELLDVTNEAELEGFLGRVVAATARNIGGRLPADTGRALVAVLRRTAERTLPTLATSRRPRGPAAGPSAAETAARVYGLELEGMSAEDRDFEIARQFLRFAQAATARAATAPRRLRPRRRRRGRRRRRPKLAPGLGPPHAARRDPRPDRGPGEGQTSSASAAAASRESDQEVGHQRSSRGGCQMFETGTQTTAEREQPVRAAGVWLWGGRGARVWRGRGRGHGYGEARGAGVWLWGGRGRMAMGRPRRLWPGEYEGMAYGEAEAPGYGYGEAEAPGYGYGEARRGAGVWLWGGRGAGYG